MNEHLLQESLSNVIDNALKYVVLASSNMNEVEDPVVLLQIRPSNEEGERK